MSEVPGGAPAPIDTVVPAMQATSAHSGKIGRLGVEVVSTLYMLIRNVRLHDPTNAVFEKPFSALRDAINTIVGVEGSFNLQAVGAAAGAGRAASSQRPAAATAAADGFVTSWARVASASGRIASASSSSARVVAPRRRGHPGRRRRRAARRRLSRVDRRAGSPGATAR